MKFNSGTYNDARKDKVNQSIGEDELRNTTPSKDPLRGIARPGEFVCVQQEDGEVEAHGINENSSENPIIGFGDDTS